MTWLRLAVVLFLTVLISHSYYRQPHVETKFRPDNPRGRKTTIILPWLLPIWFVMVLFNGYTLRDQASQTAFWSSFFPIIITISLYFGLVVISLPWLRQHFSARAVSTLWLLPNILYISLQLTPFWKPSFYSGGC